MFGRKTHFELQTGFYYLLSHSKSNQSTQFTEYVTVLKFTDVFENFISDTIFKINK